jgi:hypothetical protein
MSGEDAAWHDLVARFDLPTAPAGTTRPWPEREDLPPARHSDPRRSPDSPEPAEPEPGPATAQDTRDDRAGRWTAWPGPVTDGLDGSAGGRATSGGTGTTGRPGPASLGGFGGQDSRGLHARGLDGRGLDERGHSTEKHGLDKHGLDKHGLDKHGTDGSRDGRSPDGTDQATEGRRRVVRPATPPQIPGPAFAADAIQSGRFDEDDDEHYIPPPPPPLPALDPVAKGAWTALFGGPAFLLVTTTAGWSVPGWATFSAVAAFIGGFAMIVARMGDRPPRDSGPDDNGAVV